jgi:diaminopimelate decarboxylase
MTDRDQLSLTSRLLRDLGPEHGDGLRIGGVSAEEIAEQFGTPCYVYDAELLRRRCAEVTRSLGVDVLFAIKANPCLAVGQVLADAGAGADVASAGEVHVAMRAGFAKEKIQFAGPGKTRAELSLAVDRGVGTINLESASEYETLLRIVRERKPESPPAVAIRINPTVGVAGARMRMGGGCSKFGVDVEDVTALARRIVDHGVVSLRGLHCYLGTQVFDADAWLDSVRGLSDFASEVETSLGVKLDSLNLGGGFGVPCFEGDAEFDLDAAGDGLHALMDGDRRYFVELGRYLTAPSGVYLARVEHIKQSRGKRFAVLDGGMHHFGAATGIGAVIRRPFPIVSATAPFESGEPQVVCGPLCTPADEFASTASLQRLAVGDLVAILAAGAYGLTFSPVLFLSHPTPAEVLVDAGKAHLVRQRGRAEDALRGQFLPGEA